MEKIILVDEYDNELGVMEKLMVHVRGLRHRAFSIFIFRKIGGHFELLLQKRHPDKYHCGGLWSNTCCGHPRLNENIFTAGRRRLFEEMGLDIELESAGVFSYIANFSNGLIENEIDHVLVGFYNNQDINIDLKEVCNYSWMNLTSLMGSLLDDMESYTPWFRQSFDIAKGYLRSSRSANLRT